VKDAHRVLQGIGLRGAGAARTKAQWEARRLGAKETGEKPTASEFHFTSASRAIRGARRKAARLLLRELPLSTYSVLGGNVSRENENP